MNRTALGNTAMQDNIVGHAGVSSPYGEAGAFIEHSSRRGRYPPDLPFRIDVDAPLSTLHRISPPLAYGTSYSQATIPRRSVSRNARTGTGCTPRGCLWDEAFSRFGLRVACCLLPCLFCAMRPRYGGYVRLAVILLILSRLIVR